MIVYKLFKHIFYIILIANFLNIFANEIKGVFIPQGRFDSKRPTVTMYLDENKPPVIKIAPSRPTVVIFPIQVSRCFSDNKALKIEKADPIKSSTLQAGQESENFSAVILKVNGAAITENFLDQTQISCLLIDSSLYPIGIEFTDVDAYSIVKLLEPNSLAGSSSFDMDDFPSIRLGSKNIKNTKYIKKEEREYSEQLKEKKSFELNNKRSLEKAPILEKKNKGILVENSHNNPLKKNRELYIENEISKKLEQNGYSKIESKQNNINEITMADRLDEMGFYKIQGD